MKIVRTYPNYVKRLYTTGSMPDFVRMCPVCESTNNYGEQGRTYNCPYHPIEMPLVFTRGLFGEDVMYKPVPTVWPDRNDNPVKLNQRSVTKWVWVPDLISFEVRNCMQSLAQAYEDYGTIGRYAGKLDGVLNFSDQRAIIFDMIVAARDDIHAMEYKYTIDVPGKYEISYGPVNGRSQQDNQQAMIEHWKAVQPVIDYYIKRFGDMVWFVNKVKNDPEMAESWRENIPGWKEREFRPFWLAHKGLDAGFPGAKGISIPTLESELNIGFKFMLKVLEVVK